MLRAMCWRVGVLIVLAAAFSTSCDASESSNLAVRQSGNIASPGRSPTAQTSRASSSTSNPADHRAKPDERGTCAAAHLKLGRHIYGPAGDAGFGDAILFQWLQNTGPNCRFVIPPHMTVIQAGGGRRTIAVWATRGPTRAKMGASYRLPAGATARLFVLSAAPNNWEKEPFYPCTRRVRRPVALDLPLGTSALRIGVRGLWHDLCAAPSNRVPVAGFLVSSHGNQPDRLTH